MESTRRNAPNRKLWRGVFCVAASILICCLVVIALNPAVGSVSPWIFWLALGSSLVCAVAAVQLWSYERHDAADEGAWLASVGTRSSKESDLDLDGLDD